MKLRKICSLAIAVTMLSGVLSACNGGSSASTPTPPSTPTTAPNGGDNAPATGDAETLKKLNDLGLDENLRFKETRKITVEVYDRSNDGGSKPEDNFYTNFIKEGMLRDHNVEVTFKPVPRWTEGQEIANLLAGGTAPDICVTYTYATVKTYANMGGVVDMSASLDDNKEFLPNLWDFLGESNLYWDKDPKDGTIFAIEGLMFNNLRINTFVREDWLKKLNLPTPTTTDEFEAMLVAFRDNASTLLGADAAKMIPFSTSFDVGWRTGHLLESYLPNDINDRDFYVNDFDDRRFLQPGFKEGVRKLNDWYNEGLIWKDFALYGPGDTTEDDMLKAGYIGAFIHNWDYPYRNGDDGIAANLKKLIGEDAAFIAIEPFKNSAGVYKKFLSGPNDRKIFFPSTNKEPFASLLYLDWITKFENRSFLQIGEEGVTHETQPDGAVKTIAVTGEKIMNSPNNIDYTLTINGLDMGDPEINVASIALGYSGVDARYIEEAYRITKNAARVNINVNVGEIKAEEGQGTALTEKRNVVLDTAVVAKPGQFDSVFDSGMQDYLGSGGQAIIDERAEKWQEFFGSAVMMP